MKNQKPLLWTKEYSARQLLANRNEIVLKGISTTHKISKDESGFKAFLLSKEHPFWRPVKSEDILPILFGETVFNDGYMCDERLAEAEAMRRKFLQEMGADSIAIPCNICSKTAATLDLMPSSIAPDKRAGFHSSGFLFDVWSGSETDENLERISKAAHTNLGYLHSIDPDTFGFVCRECRIAYCRKCWRNIYERYDESFYDDTRGTCPEGHEQMLAD
ncbi:hypothetical protein HYV71_02160 [Candidatus Uhrbacteria bacterium]|nr:hypothetical protein [Candidatus Uhrbacteria bacterium]